MEQILHALAPFATGSLIGLSARLLADRVQDGEFSTTKTVVMLAVVILSALVAFGHMVVH